MIEDLRAAMTLLQDVFADALGSSTGLSVGQLADTVAEAQGVVNAASAVQTLALAHLGARQSGPVGKAGPSGPVGPDGVGPQVDRGLGFVDEFAGALVGPLLVLSPGSADARLETAAVLASKLPATLAAMASGGLDPWRARLVAQELRDASVPTCALVEARVYPAGLDDTPRALTARVRRVLAAVDADAVRVKAAKARLDRFIRMGPSATPGMTDWWGSLPAADSAACHAAIEALAHQLRGDIVDATLDQCRADALVDLITGNATITTTLTLLVPVETLTVQEPPEAAENAAIIDYLQAHPSTAPVNQDHDQDSEQDSDDAGVPSTDDADTTDGHQHRWWDADDLNGPAAGAAAAAVDLPPLARRWLDDWAHTNDFGQPVPDRPPWLPDPHWAMVSAGGLPIPGIGIIPGDVAAAIAARFDTAITRVLLDARTGTVLETTTATYRPSAGIRRFVHHRDGACRFPGCTRVAARCEIDHVDPYPHGPTTPANLITLCKHHHRAKHHGGWTLHMSSDGVATWTDRTGRTYRTHPVNHYQQTA